MLGKCSPDEDAFDIPRAEHQSSVKYRLCIHLICSLHMGDVGPLKTATLGAEAGISGFEGAEGKSASTGVPESL